MSSRKRSLTISDGHGGEEEMTYSFKVHLPNGTVVPVSIRNPGSEMLLNDFIKLVKEEYIKSRDNCEVAKKKRKTVDWDSAALSCLDFNGVKIKNVVRFHMFKPDVCNRIRIDSQDGSGSSGSGDPNYSFETAIAELIDNSLQAMWSCPPEDRRLISINVVENRIQVFDSGPGMDKQTIDKWVKIGASAIRFHKSEAIGGKPPYLVPFFGKFGFGGSMACMYLGRRVLLSTKTKESSKVITLQLEQETLVSNLALGKIWKTAGGTRDPTEEEMKLSPHGSFTKCDEIRIERPIEFEVHGKNLAAISGGVVATTNLNSMGQDFWFQIRLIVQSDTRGWATIQEANARLKFAYFPVLEGKESIDVILETLEKDDLKLDDNFQTFRRLFVRRLGRLLPGVYWASIPFMERGPRATTLQKCCRRVICFVDLDAGFDPTPSKTDLASDNAFTVALKNFGSKSKEKDNDVDILIHREGKCLRYGQVDQEYKDWVLKMHNTYDVEDASGEDEATIVVGSLDHKSLRISPDCQAVRVHKVMKRKGISWERGQNIRIAKGACSGAHKNNLYATIEYFVIEGFSDEAGGDARMICRQIKYSEEEGCKLSRNDANPRLEMRSSSSFPISIIDAGMVDQLDANSWNDKIQKQQIRDPSRTDLSSSVGSSNVVVRPSAKVASWKLLDNVKFLNVRVGFSLPPFSVASLDEFENKIPFSSVPPLNVILRASSGFNLTIDEIEANVTSRGALELKNVLVETGELDQLSPTYKAILEIGSQDEPFSVSIPCKVTPGTLVRVVECNPLSLENLLPDSTVDNYLLEMFDGYNNHAAEGTNVLISADGFSVEDWMGLNRKVDSIGCVDLSGILKVTAGYGKYVSISVMSDDEETFKRESMTVIRELRLVTTLPESCNAGSILPDLVFSVTESNGVIDTSIHHDEVSDSSHMLSLETDSRSVENAISYAFFHGFCKVGSLSLPETEGVFSFKVFHSRYPEIHMIFEIQLTPAETFERDEIKRLEVDERLKFLEAEKEQAAQQLRTLQASFVVTVPECLSTKESLMRKINEKHQDTAASVFCFLNREAPPLQSPVESNNGVFGIVALLGSVASTSLSRVLSDYIGEETMLGLVCKSSRFVPSTLQYLKLKEERLGRSITKGYHFLCLDITRRWEGVVNDDPQKTLALDTPKLPGGDPVPGFLGYAVNMIDLAPEELKIQTFGGQGLRETLFYGLFGSLQVYRTRNQLMVGLSRIRVGNAVSLDGCIVKENRFIFCGSSKPEIHFPIRLTEGGEERLRQLDVARDKVTMVTKKIAEEKCLLSKLEKRRKKTNERYYRARQVPV